MWFAALLSPRAGTASLIFFFNPKPTPEVFLGYFIPVNLSNTPWFFFVEPAIAPTLSCLGVVTVFYFPTASGLDLANPNPYPDVLFFSYGGELFNYFFLISFSLSALLVSC